MNYIHIEELLLMAEAAKEIAFVNALVAVMEKLGNYCLFEKVMMDQVVAKNVIR
jgi:hypothetical protein